MSEAETGRAIWVFAGIFVALGLVVSARFYFDQFFKEKPSENEDLQHPD